VCRIHDRLMMLMASTDFLGLQIESGSGLVFGLSFEFICMYYMMILVWMLCIWIIDSVLVSGCRLDDLLIRLT
jgi:hypothetical protein